MRETLFRFFTLEPMNANPMILWIMAGIWVLLVVNCITSLRHLTIGVGARWAWLLIIVLLPIVGMTLYLLRCIFRADYSFLKFVLGPPKKVQRELVKD
jgi:hypothetical protein